MLGLDGEVGPKAKATSRECLRCWPFGSKNGFCIGEIEWNNEIHHAKASCLSSFEMQRILAPEKCLRPWDISYVGAADFKRNLKLIPTTRPMAWTFTDPNVPQEVLVASTGPVQCIHTNGDGLCSVHSVFGVSCNT